MTIFSCRIPLHKAVQYNMIYLVMPQDINLNTQIFNIIFNWYWALEYYIDFDEKKSRTF